MHPTTLLSFETEARAARLARDACILAPAVAEFDRALSTWLESFAGLDSVSSAEASAYVGPVLAMSAEDGCLAAALARLEGPARVYAWARLWKAYDGLHAAGLGLGGVGHGLARHLLDARPGKLAPPTVLALHRYFEDIADSPTSGLYHALWDRSRGSGLLRRRAGARRDEVLVRFVRLVERRPHHHQLRDLGRILHALRPGDEHAGGALRGFAPRSDQAAAHFAGEVIRTVGLRERDRRPGALAARVMRWFLAGRARPKRPWVAAGAELSRAVGEDTLAALASWIRARAHDGADVDGAAGDELFAVAARSSDWLVARVGQGAPGSGGIVASAGGDVRRSALIVGATRRWS